MPTGHTLTSSSDERSPSGATSERTTKRIPRRPPLGLRSTHPGRRNT
ncbi:hypothetical protein SEA_QUAMMI_67 [Microbacterium phage Quammi]|nr:hypothetical protein SEA_QUAMMI_67 [Microbacterium phage Quammi]